MTNQRALELLMIERACVKRGSGFQETWITDEFNGNYVRYDKVKPECDRNCAECALVQDSTELMKMYDWVISVMTEKTMEEDKNEEWRDWQRNCDPRQPMAI